MLDERGWTSNFPLGTAGLRVIRFFVDAAETYNLRTTRLFLIGGGGGERELGES